MCYVSIWSTIRFRTNLCNTYPYGQQLGFEPICVIRSAIRFWTVRIRIHFKHMSTRQYVSIVSLRDEQFRKLYMYHLGEKGQWNSHFCRLAMGIAKNLALHRKWNGCPMRRKYLSYLFGLFGPFPVGKGILNQSGAYKSLRILYLWNISKIGYDCDRHRISVLMVICASLTFAQLESGIWLNLDSWIFPLCVRYFVKFVGHFVHRAVSSFQELDSISIFL